MNLMTGLPIIEHNHHTTIETIPNPFSDDIQFDRFSTGNAKHISELVNGLSWQARGAYDVK